MFPSVSYISVALYMLDSAARIAVFVCGLMALSVCGTETYECGDEMGTVDNNGNMEKCSSLNKGLVKEVVIGG